MTDRKEVWFVGPETKKKCVPGLFFGTFELFIIKAKDYGRHNKAHTSND